MVNAVLVLGYNNTRVNDVRKIKTKAKEFLNAVTVLCKVSPTTDDLAAADHAIDVGLEESDINVDKVIYACKKKNLNIIALLPFSDPGTQLGAALAKRLNLRGHSLEKVKAALDKGMFRKQESTCTVTPPGYKKIKSTYIQTYDDLHNLFTEYNGKLFLKPACEGNSRGCINTSQYQNLEEAWAQVSQYLKGGIVAEELIDKGEEYSWDHVCGYSWITEKQTTQNGYRAEVQQILPAPLNETISTLIADAGIFMSDVSGSNQSACHNEIFYQKDTNTVVGVEPNLRPAGMRIWDLAEIAYANFDPWKEWLLWAASVNNVTPCNLKQEYYVGIRMITAQKSGILKKLSSSSISDLNNNEAECVELTWSKVIGDAVTHTVRDNSEFIGFIIAKSKDYNDLANYLTSTCNKLSNEVEIQ